MVGKALEYIAGQLKEFIDSTASRSGLGSIPELKLDSVANARKDEQRDKDIIHMSLVNIRIDPMGRNFPIAFKDKKDPGRFSSTRLHLEVLVAFNAGVYERSLQYLSWTFGFFQEHPTFIYSIGENETMQLFVDPVSLSLEDVKNLWTPMGIPPLPFLFYNVRIK